MKEYTKDNPMVTSGEDYYRALSEGIPVVHSETDVEKAEREFSEQMRRNDAISDSCDRVRKLDRIIELLEGGKKEEVVEVVEEKRTSKPSKYLANFCQSKDFKDLVDIQPII